MWIAPCCRPARLPEIDAAVTLYAGLGEGDLKSKRRTRPVSRARHIAMYLARELGNFSYGEIGAHFGGRNHSSVVAAFKRIASLIREDEGLARDIALLKGEFGL